MQITAIPAFTDNYIWLLQQGNEVAVVDPGDAQPVMQHLQQQGLQLTAIFITHKHADHVGGIAVLKQAYADLVVYGPKRDRSHGVTHKQVNGDKIEFGGVAFQVMEVPGHTEDHIAYYSEGVLFCGDTLFAAGCGRVFDGTHEQLHQSLLRIAALPADTLCYCAHEYTLDNIGFAQWVEPENQQIKQRKQAAQQLRDTGKATVPTLLSLELTTNPFLRSKEEVVIQAAERYAGRRLTRGAEVFTAIRSWKDREYD